MTALPAGVQVWLAAGAMDLRKGFDGLAGLVQTQLAEDPFSGQLFVFRGRHGDRIKILWWDGDGLCRFARRLVREQQSALVTARAELLEVQLVVEELRFERARSKLSASPIVHRSWTIGARCDPRETRRTTPMEFAESRTCCGMTGGRRGGSFVGGRSLREIKATPYRTVLMGLDS